MAFSTLSGKAAPIHLIHLTKRYKEVEAVANVSLEIKGGEFLTLLGPSGSGKTTTLMMIAGLILPDSGDIQINERSIAQVPAYKRNIGMVFQQYALFPHMTVFENIAFPLEMRNTKRKEISNKVNWALELVKLPHVANRRPNQLSGGQQQRIALARALVFQPPILLLDEPLGALDRKLREELQIELKQIHRKLNTTIMYVTHDQEEALTLSDRIAIFDHGHILQIGTPSELYYYPKNRFVAEFVGETNLLTGRIFAKQDHYWTIQISEGIKAVGYSNGVSTDQETATFSIRPENILVGEQASSKVNCFTGVLEESTFLGEITKYRIRLDASNKLIVKKFNVGGEQFIPPGSRITIGWNPEEMVMVETKNRNGDL